MSTEVLSQNLAAGVKATFGSGTVFLIASATAPVSIVARQIGNSNKSRTFFGVPAGFKFTADDPTDGFDTLEVTSATAQAFTIAVGTDDVSFSNAVTVSGNVSTSELPASTLADTAPLVVGATTAPLFAANASRRKITVSSDPANAANPCIYFKVHSGANKLGFVQPGQSLTFSGTYAVDYTAAAAGDTLYIAEES